MKNLKYILVLGLMLVNQIVTAQTTQIVNSFNKVIISPHIETIFIKGEENSVTIIENEMADDKVNIEVKGETLRVFLDDAKMTTKHKKVKKNGIKLKMPIYKGKILTIKVTYKDIEALSLRGEQRSVCESLIDVDNFNLKIYGASLVVLNHVNFAELNADIYGESQLTIKKGRINHQKITAYGEGEINLVEVDNKTAKLKAFGETIFRVNSSKNIKFTAYGEAELYYKGNPEINRGLSFGNSKINQIN